MNSALPLPTQGLVSVKAGVVEPTLVHVLREAIGATLPREDRNGVDCKLPLIGLRKQL